MRNHGESGFTLIEVLVTLIIGGTVVAMLASSWWLIIQFGHRTHQTNLQALEQKIRLQRFISAIDMHKPINQDAVSGFSLVQNQAGSILHAWTFPGALDVPDHLSDYSLLTLATNSAAGVTMTLSCPTLTESVTVDSEPFLSQVFWRQTDSEITFEVLGQDGRWHSQWKDPDKHGLPRAIKITANEAMIFPIGSAKLFGAKP